MIRLSRLSIALLVALAGCTYGPVENRAAVKRLARVFDSYEAFAIVEYERVRQPTGLNAFPDGGRWLFLDREARLYLLDTHRKVVTEVFRIAAPDSQWETFSLNLAGLDGDSVAYLRTYGCPRGGQCYPALAKIARLRATRHGSVRPVAAFPPGIGLQGTMLAREVGERNFVRLSTSGDEITGKFEEEASYEPLFRVLDDGSLIPAGE